MPRSAFNFVVEEARPPVPKTPEEIVRIFEAHERWLKKQNGGIRADLTFQVLSGANLQGIVLRAAKLTGCDLSYARLDGADLRQCDLFSADLHGADLSDADLSHADLRGANLRDAKLRRALLDCADLRMGTLMGPQRGGRMDFHGSETGITDLRDAVVNETAFRGAKLDRANL